MKRAAGERSDVVSSWDSRHGLEVSVGEVAGALRAGGNFELIDCREEEEYAICRLPGARLLPLAELVGSGWQGLVEPPRVVVVYCHHGMRSAHAVEFLRARGCRRAFSMAGGIDHWSREVDAGVARY